jgi:protein involved in plasmid replication-relaxation
MELATRSPRLNRWSDEPVLRRDGSPFAIEEHELRPSDLQVFELLARFRYLRTSYLAALIGGNAKHRQRRLSALARKPNKYLCRPDIQRRTYAANYRDQVYELAPRGEAVLARLGKAIPQQRLGDERQFAHAMMVNDTLASLALGARPGRLVWWDEIRAHPKFPTRAGDKMQVEVRHAFEDGRVEHAAFEYTNDSGGIFAIEDGGPYRFFSFEAEHTNRVDCGNLRQTSFLKKFLTIRHIMESQLHVKQWRIPNLLYLVVAPNQSRIDTMKKLILRETGGKGAPYVLFREVPTFDDFDRVCRPMAELATAPWQRAGYPDICMLERR